MLDRELRERLLELAEFDAQLLDRDMQLRILRRVAAAGPRIVRRARAERIVTISGGMVLAAAAGLALLVGARAPGISAPNVGAERADLPDVVINLPAGRLMLSAAQFGQGALRITTPQGDVVTQDAVLAVEMRQQKLFVEVADGSAVIRGRRAEQRVFAGSRVEVSAEGAAKHALDSAAREALRKSVERR